METLLIESKKNTLQIVVDGNEMKDVLRYELAERANELPTLTLEMAITGKIEARL